jgi:hypothetical protein
MRDPKRIPIIISAIQRLWEENPDFRLAQLIVNVIHPDDLCPQVFYCEDDDLLERLQITCLK